jgi:hypothetical protein
VKTVVRTMLVHDRLVHSLVDEIGATARPMTRFEWAVADLSDPSNLHKPYGWIPPYEVEGDPDDESATIIAPFCPGLIAEQTRFLYDSPFEEYVDIIDYSMSLQIIHRHLPWPEREAAVDHRMWEEASGSMELQNRIQMRILDTLTEAGH